MKTKIPSAYVLLFYIIVVMGLLTYIVPAGNFDREFDAVKGINYVIPGSYHSVESSPVSIFELFRAIPDGMMQASNIIIFILITGGSFGIIQATGAINTSIGNISRRFIGHERKIIPIIMILFSLAGAMFGTAEEALPLYPVFVALALGMGFDRITGVAMVLLGTGSGFAAGFLNPFTTGVAQGIAGLPLFSGIGLRLIAYVLILSSSIIYVYWYAGKKIVTSETEPNDGDIGDLDGTFDYDIERLDTVSNRDTRVIVTLLISFGFLIYGIASYKFYILEICTTFFITGIACGIVAGLKSGRIAGEFVKGASNIVYGALIIGFARAITVVMEYGNIMDTIIFQLAQFVQGFPPVITAIIMFIVHSLINLFVTSGSGQAAMTMPIMTVLADISGVTRQTAVLAFQFGDGFTNVISPTSGYFMAALAISGVSWKKWVKWMLPLFVVWCIIGCFVLVTSVIIEYGPF